MSQAEPNAWKTFTTPVCMGHHVAWGLLNHAWTHAASRRSAWLGVKGIFSRALTPPGRHARRVWVQHAQSECAKAGT